MSLELDLHPLSSYCHKALIAFYENGISFVAKRVDDPAIYAESKSLWPMARSPLLRDTSRDVTPALFYVNRFFGPFRQSHPRAMAYLDRLMARPSYARALREAEPFMHLSPK